MGNPTNELACLAQTKITVAQSALLDEMARTNNTTRSYELRMILELYGKERLHVDDDRKEHLEAERACLGYYELLKDVYSVREVYSLPWYTGIQFTLYGIVGKLELEMLNKTTRRLLFRYTNRFLPPIQKRYPEIAQIMIKVMEMTHENETTLECFMGAKRK